MTCGRLNLCLIALASVLFCAARASAREKYYVAFRINRNGAEAPQACAWLVKTTASPGDGGHRIETQKVDFLPNSAAAPRGTLPMDKALADLAEQAGPVPRAGLWRVVAVKKSFYDALSANGQQGLPGREANRLVVLRGLEPWLLPRDKAPDWLTERLQIQIAESR